MSSLLASYAGVLALMPSVGVRPALLARVPAAPRMLSPLDDVSTLLAKAMEMEPSKVVEEVQEVAQIIEVDALELVKQFAVVSLAAVGSILGATVAIYVLYALFKGSDAAWTFVSDRPAAGLTARAAAPSEATGATCTSSF